MLTLFTVLKAGDGREARACIESFRRYAETPFAWVFVTERENVERVERMIPGEQVEAMPGLLLGIGNGYLRQMAAKMIAHEFTDARDIVITDDDTQAVAPWSRDTFFKGDKARIYYTPTRHHFWSRGNVQVFGTSPRDWQLRLPFAIRRETLCALQASPYFERCMAAWFDGHEALSEFAAMGEFAYTSSDPHALTLSTLTALDHWTIGTRPKFRDWQRMRRSLRRSLKASVDISAHSRCGATET